MIIDSISRKLFFFSFFLSRNRFNETRETCSETFYVNSSDFYDSFSLCIFSSSATLSYYVISLRNEKLIGSFLCISIDSFDDTKTVRKFLTGFDISCHRAMLQTRYHVITRYYDRDISRSRNAANKIFCFHSSNRVYVQIYTTIVYSKSNSSNFYNSVSLEFSLRNIPSFTLFRTSL